MKIRIIKKPEYMCVHHVQKTAFGMWFTVFAGTLSECEKVVESLTQTGTVFSVIKEVEVL